MLFAGTRPGPLVFGHLGNSLEGLRSVVRSGAGGVEFDVRRSADGALVLHHDPSLATGELVSQLARRDIPGSIPDLGAALDVCPAIVVNIEVKNLPIDPDRDPEERTAIAVAELVGSRGLQDRVIVSAFAMESIDAVRAVDPRILTALLTLPRVDQVAATTEARRRGHRAVHPHHRGVTAALVTEARRQGLAIHPWAVDEAEVVLAMKALGVDAIISDAPVLALRTLAQSRDR